MNHPPPWYKQFWPWFLFGLPGIVVVAGLTTWWIAERHADDLVVDEYYKEGLAINRELAKQELARTLGVVAQLELRGNILAVTLEGDTSPSALKLLLSHPVDAKLDQELLLAQVSTGNYETRWQAGNHPRWHWHLEPLGVSEQEHWRIDGEISGLSADGH